MKKHLPFLLVAALGLGCALLMPPVGAQNAVAPDPQLPLVQSILDQQKLINENQAAIEKSVASIQENVRQAKIYVSRGGKANTK